MLLIYWCLFSAMNHKTLLYSIYVNLCSYVAITCIKSKPPHTIISNFH